MAHQNQRNPFDNLAPVSRFQRDLIEIARRDIPIVEHANQCQGFCDNMLCGEFKRLIAHIPHCENSRNCVFERCQRFKDMYNHMNSCMVLTCQICPPSVHLRNVEAQIQQLEARVEEDSDESEESDQSMESEDESEDDNDWDSDTSFFTIDEN